MKVEKERCWQNDYKQNEIDKKHKTNSCVTIHTGDGRKFDQFQTGLLFDAGQLGQSCPQASLPPQRSESMLPLFNNSAWVGGRG